MMVLKFEKVKNFWVKPFPTTLVLKAGILSKPITTTIWHFLFRQHFPASSDFQLIFPWSGGSSIRVKLVPEDTRLDSPGEHREFCDITCEGLTHSPDFSFDAIVQRDDKL